MVFEHQGSYETQAGAIAAITPQIGCFPQSLQISAKPDSDFTKSLTAVSVSPGQLGGG